jgi:hypothetical protein
VNDIKRTQIWHDAIWVTHEYDALVATGLVNQIVEIRPEDVGLAADDAAPDAVRYITHYPYRECTLIGWCTAATFLRFS